MLSRNQKKRRMRRERGGILGKYARMPFAPLSSHTIAFREGARAARSAVESFGLSIQNFGEALQVSARTIVQAVDHEAIRSERIRLGREFLHRAIMRPSEIRLRDDPFTIPNHPYRSPHLPPFRIVEDGKRSARSSYPWPYLDNGSDNPEYMKAIETHLPLSAIHVGIDMASGFEPSISNVRIGGRPIEEVDGLTLI